MLIAISANIGTGKTTLLRRLKDAGYSVIEEDVDSWEYLKDFYLDKHTAVLFQLEVMLSRHKQYQSALKTQAECKDNIVIIERSTLDSLYVFAKNALQQGNMRPIDYQLLESYTKEFGLFPDKTIYLRCEPEVSYQRKTQRNRKAEVNLDINYIQEIHEKYEEFAQRLEPMDIIDVTDLTPDEVQQYVIDVLFEYIHNQ